MNIFRRGIFLLALGLGGAWILRTFLYEPAIVESASMEPTLQEGVHYIVNRWVYHVHVPLRGEIISFISPIDHETRYIKRVIAVPNDEIQLKNKTVFLNGQAQEESYVMYQRAKEHLDGDNLGPLKVPANTVFVLGDNRDVSYDSTSWLDPQTKQHLYFLPYENIKGRVVKL